LLSVLQMNKILTAAFSLNGCPVNGAKVSSVNVRLLHCA